MEMVALAAAQQLADDVDAWGMPVLRALLPVAGMTVIEQQAERARAIGIQCLLLLVDGVPAGLVEACDRIRSRGMTVHLVRDNAQVAAQLGAKRRLVLVADGLIAGPRAWGIVKAASPSTLLTVPDESATAGLERIDAISRWAGLALLPASAAIALEQAPADWDPQLTLFRQAVQSGATQLPCDLSWFVSGEMQLAVSPDAAAEAEERLLSQRTATEPGIADRWLWGPLLRLAAPRLLVAQTSGKVARVATLVFSVTCAALALLGQPLAMSVVGVVAAATHTAGRFIAGFRPESPGWQRTGQAGFVTLWLALALADRAVIPGTPTFPLGSGGMSAAFALLIGSMLARQPEASPAAARPIIVADMTVAWLLTAVLTATLGWRTGFDVTGIVMLIWLAGQLALRRADAR